jgi:hypothetical protein
MTSIYIAKHIVLNICFSFLRNSLIMNAILISSVIDKNNTLSEQLQNSIGKS